MTKLVPSVIAAASWRQARRVATSLNTTAPTGSAKTSAVSGRVMARQPDAAASASNQPRREVDRHWSNAHHPASQSSDVRISEK